MRHRPWLARAALFVAVLGGSSTSIASEARPAIVIGEVSGRTAGADEATLDLFRWLVQRELGRLELDHATRAPSYVFSASLERLDVLSSREGSHAVCIVSGALRRAGNGTIVALLHGSGAVDGDRSALPGTRAKAIEVAVHGAVRRLPEAL